MPSSKHRHRQREQCPFHPPPLFWDKLAKLWLTKSALREANRRNKPPSPSQGFPPISHIFAPDFLHNCSATCLQEIRKLSRCGGPDLSDIRNYPAPSHFSQFSMEPTNSSSKPPMKNTATKPKTGSTTVYDPHFEDHLINHGVYPPFSRYPDGTALSKPENFAEMQSRLQIPRPSRSMSPGSLEKEYAEFAETNAKASDEQLVIKNILPILEGKQKACAITGGGHLFKNLAHLTDGTLANAKPDFYHSAPLNQLNLDIQKQLNNQIIPSSQSNRPIAPNFLVEAKDHAGSACVARRQALYNGALGARAMHSLQQFGHEDSSNMPADYDDKAYTMTSTYQDGTLGLYATHPTRSRDNNNPDRHTDYVMTQFGQWALHGNPETFQQGITAYRNARDMTKEQRDKFIRQANERYAASAGGFNEEQQVLSDEAGEVNE
ncbi:hypothetical protein BDW59DRAFT_115860 [Aspergillus cavernicola]|uniref:Uncharacterized protein n=1 Tax=Aspergillus cavernicola TaxID=176166 RepID=A0ABR4IWM3_9EURO